MFLKGFIIRNFNNSSQNLSTRSLLSVQNKTVVLRSKDKMCLFPLQHGVGTCRSTSFPSQCSCCCYERGSVSGESHSYCWPVLLEVSIHVFSYQFTCFPVFSYHFMCFGIISLVFWYHLHLCAFRCGHVCLCVPIGCLITDLWPSEQFKLCRLYV